MATQCSRARNGTSGMCFSLLCRAPTSAKSKFGDIQWGSMHFAACEQWVAHSPGKKVKFGAFNWTHSLTRWKFNPFSPSPSMNIGPHWRQMHFISLGKQHVIIWLPCYHSWPATHGSLSLIYITYAYLHIYTHIKFPEMTLKAESSAQDFDHRHFAWCFVPIHSSSTSTYNKLAWKQHYKETEHHESMFQEPTKPGTFNTAFQGDCSRNLCQPFVTYELIRRFPAWPLRTWIWITLGFIFRQIW